MQKESVLVLLGLLILSLSLFWGVDGGVTGNAAITPHPLVLML